MRAVLYARFSTERQNVASIEDQFRECERVAKAAGLEVVERFSDAAISGGTASRPGYQAMLTAARAGKFDVVITEDISRLWRNRAEFGPRSAELEDLGVHCVTCVGDDTRREGWGLVIQIKQAMAEHGRRETSYRTRRGLEGRARQGKPAGGRAFGYIPAGKSGTGNIEIDEAQAAVVRRIFTMYASGTSPRAIAAALNADGVISPGATWKRTERRTDGKWLASTIHGDVRRGLGILNNRAYVGIVVWGQCEWKRSAVDSAKRRVTVRAAAIERAEERLRIVPQELWDRAKARQAAAQRGIGKLIRGGHERKNKPGAGRPPKFLFSGMMTCASCGASMVLRNRTCYCCASYWNGAACSNSINVPVTVVQKVLLDGFREDLRDPAVVDEFERRFKIAMRAPKAADQGKRISQLGREIEHMTAAIAGGLLSPALAQKLREAEGERERLKAPPVKRVPSILVPNVRARFSEMVTGLEQILLRDPERGREELRGILEGKIKLQPDESGKFLWADYSLGLRALLPNAEIMVAGAGFEPATFGL
jgi:site-specific DNA recombinase